MDFLLLSALPLVRAIETTRSPFVLDLIGDGRKVRSQSPSPPATLGVWVCRIALPLVPTHSPLHRPSRCRLQPPGHEVEAAESASLFLSEIAQSFVAIY